MTADQNVEIDSSGARTEILSRIRKANGGASDRQQAEKQWKSIDRSFRRAATLSEVEILDLLTDRLRDYDANVFRVSKDRVAETVAKLLRDRGLKRIVVPPGLEKDWLPSGFDFVLDAGLAPAELDGCEGVLTSAMLAIAETGSVVLQSVPGQGRRAVTLVPDYHLCIVATRDVVETVPEAIRRLEPTSALPITFFSGPSATADIEMTRIKGVHGPRFLDVILVEA